MAGPSPPEFLTSILSKYTDPAISHPPARPFVTLTFAQSLDAKIAGQNGKQLILSCKESMIMTHWMRTMHDAILVGIGTALNDNPQLNTRQLPPHAPESTRRHLPRPVILDSRLRLSPTCKLLINYKNGQGRRPWVLCASSAAVDDPTWDSRLKTLQDAGARVVQIQIAHPRAPGDTDDQALQLPIPAVLSALHGLGIQSLMVEGGARVIASFFAASSAVDTVIITVAPTFVGADGVGYGIPLGVSPGFQYIKTEMTGKDAVVAFTAADN